MRTRFTKRFVTSWTVTVSPLSSASRITSSTVKSGLPVLQHHRRCHSRARCLASNPWKSRKTRSTESAGDSFVAMEPCSAAPAARTKRRDCHYACGLPLNQARMECSHLVASDANGLQNSQVSCDLRHMTVDVTIFRACSANHISLSMTAPRKYSSLVCHSKVLAE